MSPIVVVYTDNGQQVWQSPAMSLTLRSAKCPSNTSGSSLISGLRRAVEDAEAIEEGRDPERPSERAVRLAAEERERREGRLAEYTKRHMKNLRDHGETKEPFTLGDLKSEQRARSRITNAASRIGVKVHTNVRWGEHGPVIVGRIRKEGT